MSHTPGHISSGDDDGGSASSAIGLTLYAPGTGAPIGILRRNPSGGLYIEVPYQGQGPGGPPSAMPFQAGEYWMPSGDGALSLQIGADGNIVARNQFSLQSSSSGSQGPAFSSTQAGAAYDRETHERLLRDRLESEGRLSEQQIQADMGMLRARLDAEAAEGRLSREFQARQDFLQSASQLALGYADLQRQAQQWLAETVGRDPSRAAVAMQGGVGIGVTPTETFRGALTQTANTPAPTVDPFAPLPQLEQQVGTLREAVGQGLPQQPAALRGMMHGGTVKPQQGAGGATFGGTGYGVLTGEEEGGRIDGSAEMIHVKPDGTIEVIPIQGGAVQGATLSQGSLGELRPLAPIFERAGLGGIPLSARGGAGWLEPGPIQRSSSGFGSMREALEGMGSQADTLRRLGISPGLIRDSTTGAIYRVVNGQLQHIPSMGAFNTAFGSRTTESNPMENVVNLRPDAIAQMGYQAPNALGFGEGRSASDIAQAGAGIQTFTGEPLATQFRANATRTTPIVHPSGALLPDPMMFASIWGGLDDISRIAILSAYGVSGYYPEQLEQRIQAFTPRGTGRQGALAIG